jgi:malate dehydrogenase (oxaloacetate-decarboxylating)(NADP+)
MVAQGLDEHAARQRCWLVDTKGLVVKKRAELAHHKVPYAHDHETIGDFLAAIRALKPTAIIGVSAVGGTFTPEVLKEMARINERPIVFALSNPTSQAECTAEEAYLHTGGRALFACGSPFDPVTLNGKTFVPRQGNNSYIFPGIGLGAVMSKSQRITDEMFMGSAHTLASLTTESDLEQGSLYPALSRVREVSAHIAAGLGKTAHQRGIASSREPADLFAQANATMYDPHY